MKKVLMILLALAMVFSMAGVVSADDTQDVSGGNGESTSVDVTQNVDYSFTVRMPVSIPLATAQSYTDEGFDAEVNLEVIALQVDSDTNLFVKISSPNKFNVTANNGNSKIPYKAGLLTNGEYVDCVDGQSVLQADRIGAVATMKFFATDADIKAAKNAGKHTDSLTFSFTFEEKTEYFIGTKEELFAFADSVNNDGKSYNGKTVKLIADIDLENEEVWTPVGQTGATQFMGVFDGQGHTISNLKIDSSAQTGAHYSSGIFGWLNKATVKNLNVDGATVTGNHNVGVIAGYMETSGCTIENCYVTDATVTCNHANEEACGDKAGVIVGHAGNAGVQVKGCTADDSTVKAGRDAGQIVGAALEENVVGCSAEDVTVSATGDCTGANIQNAVIGRIL